MLKDQRGCPSRNKIATVLILGLLLTVGYAQFFAFFMLYCLVRGFIREDLKPNSFPGLRETWAYWVAIFQEPMLVPSPKPVRVSRPHTFRPAPSPLSHKWMPGR